MNLPIPPFAWPLVLGFLVAVYYAIFPPTFPLLGLSAHAFYGILFLSFSVAAILVGVLMWLWQRARDRKLAARNPTA